MKTARRLGALGLVAAACAAAASLPSCGGETGGALISIPFEVGGAPRAANLANQPLTFTTPLGWTVTLQAAYLAAGPFYFNVDPPQTLTYHSGVFIMQATEQVLVNVLDPTLVNIDGGADGETGTAIAAEIELYPPDGTGPAALTTELGNDQGFIQGTAQLGNAIVNFQGFLIIDEALATPPEPLPYLERVNGASCNLNFASSAQTLTLTIDPTHWFDQTDFSTLIPVTVPATSDGGLDELPDGGPLPVVDAGPVTYTVDGWLDTSLFNLKLVTGVQSIENVYTFNLVSSDGG